MTTPFRTALLAAVLTAIFLLAPRAHAQFPGAGGDYGGILEADLGGEPDNSGLLIVRLSDSGASTIKLFWQGQAYALKGAFDSNSSLTRDFAKKGVTDGTKLSLFCSLDSGSRTISGVLNDPTADGGSFLSRGFTLTGERPNADVVAQLTPGLRVAFIDPNASPAPREGGPAQGSSFSSITEDGYTFISIGKDARRSTRLVGRLPDSTSYSAASPLRGTQYALRAGLYAQRNGGSGGQVLGLGNAAASPAAAEAGPQPRSVASLIAALRWHKNGGISTPTYPQKIDQRFSLNAVTYTADRDFTYVLTGERRTQRNATLRVAQGNLIDPLSVGLSTNLFGATILGDNPHKMKLTVTPANGRFTGSFKHPDTGETIRFQGAFTSFVNVTPGEGRGNFLSRGLAPRTDPAQARSGSVRITVD